MFLTQTRVSSLEIFEVVLKDKLFVDSYVVQYKRDFGQLDLLELVHFQVAVVKEGDSPLHNFDNFESVSGNLPRKKLP